MQGPSEPRALCDYTGHTLVMLALLVIPVGLPITISPPLQKMVPNYPVVVIHNTSTPWLLLPESFQGSHLMKPGEREPIFLWDGLLTEQMFVGCLPCVRPCAACRSHNGERDMDRQSWPSCSLCPTGKGRQQ